MIKVELEGPGMNGTRLSRHHRSMLLEGSAIAQEVAEARGYRTIETKADLERLGFGRNQRKVPGLLIPIYGPAGDVVLYQFRPDEPRINRGKLVRYETPAGSRMVFDVHPVYRHKLIDPTTALFVTEGIKKGDALVSQGLCAIALIGVWTWRGTNPAGGKTILPEWEHVALNGRQVYVVFDSDVMLKSEVHAALARLKSFLESRGAEVAPIYLPAGAGGNKQGVDDYLASGKTPDDLLSLATNELRSPPQEEHPERSCPYRETSAGLVWDKPTKTGPVPTPIANFAARIVRDVAEDDGAEVVRRFELEATLNGRRETFSIPSAVFTGMGWVTEHLGAGAILYPGSGVKDHVRAAVQMTSGDVTVERVYAHTGWREVDGEWIYLHSGGAIGRDGQVEGVRTELSGALDGRVLPAPPEGDELIRAVLASLDILSLAPDKITIPMISAVYRAVLGDTDFGLHLSGPTGEGKSELAALCQQHYGAGLDARNLVSWESSDNSIEGLAFKVKDQVMVLDDFAPTGTTHDIQRWHKKADRVLRAKGNASGRQRMRADTTLRPEKPPRALILSTGEDVPRGQSLRARMLVMELEPGDVRWGELTTCQCDASDGRLASALSGYIRWSAASYDGMRAGLLEERADIRDAAAATFGAQHRRTSNIVGDLALGLRYFLRFAQDCGAVNAERAEEVWAQGWRAFAQAATEQHGHQDAGEPTGRFREFLSAAIASGRAHVASVQGKEPEAPDKWGWRSRLVGSGDFAFWEWMPQGERIGWVDEEDLYLQPNASFAAAQRQGRDSGDALTVTVRTLRKRLDEHGLLVSTDVNRETLTVRRTLGDTRREVLHVRSNFLFPRDDGSDQPDHEGNGGRARANSAPPLWSSGSRQKQSRSARKPE